MVVNNKGDLSTRKAENLDHSSSMAIQTLQLLAPTLTILEVGNKDPAKTQVSPSQYQ